MSTDFYVCGVKKRLLGLKTSNLMWGNKTPEETSQQRFSSSMEIFGSKMGCCTFLAGPLGPGVCKLERHDPVLFKKEKKLMETVSSICYQGNACSWSRACMTIVLFSKHPPPLFWVCFFPTGLSVLHPAGRPQQCIATHVERQPAERRQTQAQVLLPHIWDLRRPSCSGCHQSEGTNEPVHRSCQNWYDDGARIRLPVRYRSKSSINMLTQFYPRERVKYRARLLSLTQVGLWVENVIVNSFTCHINHDHGGGGG